MTTPVFTQAVDNERSNISIQIVLPSEKELPRYNQSITGILLFASSYLGTSLN